MAHSVFRMAVFTGTNIRMMLVILYCCTFFVGNAPVIYTWRCQYHSDVYRSKRSCTFTLRNLCDGYERLDQDHWPVLGCLVCSLNGHESASSRNPDSSAMLGKVIFLLESKHCEMSGVHLDTEHTNSTVGALKFRVLVKMEKALHCTFSSVCRQNAQMKCCVCNWRGLCSLDGSMIYIDICVMVRLIDPSFSYLCSVSCLGYPGQDEWILINSSTHEITSSIAEILDNTADILNTVDSNSFPYFPNVIRSFLHSLMFNNILNTQRYFIISAVWRLTCNMYMFWITLVLLCQCKREENTDNQDTITSTFLHIRCFIKCHWYQMHWSWISFAPQKAGKESVNYDDIQQLHSRFFQKQTSELGILNEYIFQPWHWKSGIENTELFLDPSTLGDHHRINHSLFSDCHQQTDNFPNPDLMTINVNPVTRFLPDPTFNQDIDLSHVGYRLATLATLPAHVSVSRVRLAEAGFYFRGRDEEVTCYSCHMCHSDWSRGGDPMDIHRELSPRCEHVLTRDREVAALASRNNPIVHLNVVHTEGGQRSALSNSTPENSHVEDSDSSETQTLPSLPVPSESMSFPLRSAPSITSTPEGFSMPMATSVQAHRRVLHEPNTHASYHADPNISRNTSQNSVTSHSLNVTSGHTETRNAQSSVVNFGNLSASTSSMIHNGNPTFIRTAAANANTAAETRSLSDVQIQGAGSNSVDESSSGESVQHLYPRAQLDLGRAVYPVYQNMATRRRSFTSGWDDSRAPPLDEVILCGMFYAGYADCVRCFFCGVGLKHWKVTDNVWTEHIRWRPACDYLRAVKGDDFIRATLRQLGISNPTGEAGQNSSQHLAQAQVIQPLDESSQPNTTSTAMSSQSQPIPAAVLASSSSATRGTDITSTTSTSTSISSPAASSRTSSGSSEETGTVRGSPPEPATATAAPSSGSVDEPGGQRRCGGERGGAEGREREARVAEIVENASAEGDRLARMQAENRRLSQRFRCHVCHQAAIDTILMPCGHLVMCSTCTSSVTSCPLCGHSIRATAHVYMDN